MNRNVQIIRRLIYSKQLDTILVYINVSNVFAHSEQIKAQHFRL